MAEPASATAISIAEMARAPLLAGAIRALSAGDVRGAEAAVRACLDRDPGNVAAICVLGDIAARSGLFGEAERAFERALTLFPDFTDARINLAKALGKSQKLGRAIDLLGSVAADDPRYGAAQTLRSSMLAQAGFHDEALEWNRRAVRAHPDDAEAWARLGHELKTVGRRDECLDAYRRAIALRPAFGEAWWGIANLKIGALGAGDIAAMLDFCPGLDRTTPSAVPFLFALARALEDSGDAAQAFAFYSEANALQRSHAHYDPAATRAEVDAAIASFDRDFFAQRANCGSGSDAPIFVLGMPRSGSTLVEQILASHSQVEGTSELPVIPALVNQLLASPLGKAGATFPEVLPRVAAPDLRAAGEAYLEAAAIYRHSARPHFIDKLPNNWENLALILVALPNARIIDARREARACCFGNFKQYFPAGQEYSTSLTHLARYRRDYERAMAHFDCVVPGRIVRVDHEALVLDPEREIAALLDRLGLAREAACFAPHRTQRAVRTASAEQVRRPIDASGLEAWRRFEPWLGELFAALGGGEG